jgi:hypothetical protein
LPVVQSVTVLLRGDVLALVNKAALFLAVTTERITDRCAVARPPSQSITTASTAGNEEKSSHAGDHAKSFH